MMMRSICTSASAATTTAALALTGCTSAAEPDEPESAAVSQALVTEKTAIEPPAELKIKNRTFVRLGKARMGPGRLTRPAVDESQLLVGQEKLRQMTTEELAEALRPIALVGGYEYALPEPDYELAERILRGESVPTTAESLGREGRACCGDTDNRVYKSNNTSVPLRYTLFSQYGCSGAIISDSTAITAAHCVYDTEVNSWKNKYCEDGEPTHRAWWARGVDGRDSNPRPYGWQDCFVIIVLSGYIDAETPQEGYPLDFAVLDFKAGGCNDQPGLDGHFGTRNPTAGDLENVELRVYGYPEKTNPDGPIANIDDEEGPGVYRYTDSGNCTIAGEIWGMAGQPGDAYLWPDADGIYIKTETIDMSKGTSGSGAFFTFGSGSRRNRQVVGNAIYSASQYNMIRRFDRLVWMVFKYYSNFPY
jgi:V8-like Glu-specific endopeptidase